MTIYAKRALYAICAAPFRQSRLSIIGRRCTILGIIAILHEPTPEQETLLTNITLLYRKMSKFPILITGASFEILNHA